MNKLEGYEVVTCPISAVVSTISLALGHSVEITRVNSRNFAIHVLLYQRVSGMFRNDTMPVALRSQAHWPFRWHHGSFFDANVERPLVHGYFSRGIGMKDRLDVPPGGTIVFPAWLFSYSGSIVETELYSKSSGQQASDQDRVFETKS